MKTISIPDEMFDKLQAMADELYTQDNRGTAKPYLFQVQTDEKVWIDNLNGDHMVILDEDYQEVGPYGYPTLAEIALYQDVPLPDCLTDDDDARSFLSDIEEWLKKNGDYYVKTYSIKHRLQNAFFTAKACKAHIKGNVHHYDNPVDYLSYAFRNPEMQLVFDLLKQFTSSL